VKLLRYGFTLAAAGILLYLFWPLLGEIRESAQLLGEINPGWLAAALLLQFVSYCFLTSLNYQLLRPFPGRITFWRLMAVLPAMAFIEVAVPSAGASGLVLRTRLLGRSGYSMESSAFSLAAETFFEAAVKIMVSLAGLWYLLQAGQVQAGQLALLGLALLLAIVGGRRFWQVVEDRARMQRWLLRQLTRWNRLAPRLGQQRRSPLVLKRRLHIFYEGLARMRQVPLRSFWLASGAHVALDVASLWACFAAFDYLMPAGTLLTGYGLMLALSGLAALPGGLGLADASLAVIFARLNAPGAVALAGALLYRLMAFWLLRLIGLLTWQLLEARRAAPAADPTTL
jgi:uncharacterized protein (TIRG00374 family)